MNYTPIAYSTEMLILHVCSFCGTSVVYTPHMYRKILHVTSLNWGIATECIVGGVGAVSM